MKRVLKLFGALTILGSMAAGAYYYFFMRSRKPQVELYFDDGSMLAMQGNTAPYLQYAYVRAAKILAYADNGAGGTDAPIEPYEIGSSRIGATADEGRRDIPIWAVKRLHMFVFWNNFNQPHLLNVSWRPGEHIRLGFTFPRPVTHCLERRSTRSLWHHHPMQHRG